MIEKADNTLLALDRTVLANERTYQAWLRTGLSLFASGLGVAKFLKEEMSLWIILLIAGVLLVFSAFAFLQAAWRYQTLHLRISHLDIKTLPVWKVKMTSFVLAGCSLLALVGILVTAYDEIALI